MATLNTTNIKHASSSSNNIVLAADGSVSMPNSSFGKILQVVQTVVTGSYSEAFANTTSSASCGLDLNITPSATSSKILIMAQANVSNSDAIDTSAGIVLFRGCLLYTSDAADE